MIAPYKTRFKNKLSKEQKKINQSHLDFNSDNFYYGPDIDNLKIDGKKDPGAIGLSHVLRETSKLCENLKIVASGQGGDEIYSNNQDYSFGKPNPYKFPDDLELVFPWENFYALLWMGWMFKALVAFIDTPIIYLALWALRDKIQPTSYLEEN